MSRWHAGDRVQIKVDSLRGAQHPLGSAGTVTSTTIFDMPGFVFVEWDVPISRPEDVHETELEPERKDEQVYTPAKVYLVVKRHEDRLFAPYVVGRSPTWTCDQRTKDVWCIGRWLDEELTHLNVGDDVRRTQGAEFNRYSRSNQDLWLLASEVLNAAVEGRVDVNRKTHRRWG